jgi:hypothetical protein
MPREFTTEELDAIERMASRELTTEELDEMARQSRPKPKTEREIAAEAAQQAFEDSSGLQKFGIGLAKPFVETYQGARSLLGGDEDVHSQERLKAIHGGAATAGELAGNVAMFAVPGAAASRVVRAGQLVPKFPYAQKAVEAAARARNLGLATDLAASTALSGTQSTGRGERFLEGAKEGALGSLGGAAVGKAGMTVLRGMRPGSSFAQRMADIGVPLTPGQYANGPVRWTEDRLAALPFVGEQIKKRQAAAFEPWNREIYRDVLGGVLSKGDAEQVVKAGGQKGFAEIDNYISKMWTNLDAHRVKFNGKLVRGREIHEQLNRLEDDIRYARKNGLSDVAATKQEKLNRLRNRITNESPAWLDAYDMASQTYSELMTVAKAGRYKAAREQEGVFSPRELLQATAVRDKSKAFNRGENMMQRRAQEAQRVIGASYPNMAEQVVNPLVAGGAVVAGGPLVAAGLAGASVPFVTKTGGTWARGELGIRDFLPESAKERVPEVIARLRLQKNIREIEDALAKLGLRGSSVGGAHAASEDEEE